MNPIRLERLLDRVTKEMGIAPRLRQGLAIALWPRVVGPEIARQTRAGPILNGLLMVRTANPVLAHQLALLEREILQRYRGILGGRYVRGMRVRVGEVEEGESPSSPEVSAHPAALPPEKEEELSAWAAGIPDPELAAAFLRAARAWARRMASNGRAGGEGYERLMTGDTWPTAAEIEAAWEEIEPSRREAVRARVVEELRRKILRRLRARPLDAGALLRLRGDLRRLALAQGYRPERISRQTVADLLGPEAAREWPEGES